MSDVCFIDTETTGLDPERHEIWEVALIAGGLEFSWKLSVDLGRADPKALEISGYRERAGKYVGTPKAQFAEEFSNLTWGAHLAGAMVSFDEERLRKLLRSHGAAPGWHYHLIDVEALAVGYIKGLHEPREASGGC